MYHSVKMNDKIYQAISTTNLKFLLRFSLSEFSPIMSHWDTAPTIVFELTNFLKSSALCPYPDAITDGAREVLRQKNTLAEFRMRAPTIETLWIASSQFDVEALGTRE